MTGNDVFIAFPNKNTVLAVAKTAMAAGFNMRQGDGYCCRHIGSEPCGRELYGTEEPSPLSPSEIVCGGMQCDG